MDWLEWFDTFSFSCPDDGYVWSILGKDSSLVDVVICFIFLLFDLVFATELDR